MQDFLAHMKGSTEISEEQQKSAGRPIGGTMGEEHKEFVQKLSEMINRGVINPHNVETFLNKEIYDALDETTREKISPSLSNIATLLTHVVGFYQSKQTPDACPQLETMIEQLWEMKNRVETSYGNIFIF